MVFTKSVKIICSVIALILITCGPYYLGYLSGKQSIITEQQNTVLEELKSQIERTTRINNSLNGIVSRMNKQAFDSRKATAEAIARLDGKIVSENCEPTSDYVSTRNSLIKGSTK